MRYMLTIYGDPSGMEGISQEEMQADHERWMRYTEELQKSGVMVAGDALQRSDTATTLRFDGGEPTITDGPFAETKEQLGGFYLLECANLDEALGWAKKLPTSRAVAELRPAQDFSENGDQ
jgi:hypothetical protein